MNKELTINGRRFVQNKKNVTDTLFDGKGSTASGSYKRLKNGFQLFNLQGKLFAFLVVKDSTQWIVSASKQLDGQVRYMNGMCSLDERYLGLEDISYSKYQNIVEEAIKSFNN